MESSIHRRFLLWAAVVFATLPQVFAQLRVEESQLIPIRRTAPIYPPIARQARVTGEVTLQYGVTTAGKVINMKVLSGNGMLAYATAEAVQEWIYRPYMQDGEPVEVITDITISYKIDDSALPPVVHDYYVEVFADCRSKYEGNDYVNAEGSCRDAAKRSFTNSKGSFEDSVYALSMLANSLLMQKKFEEAIAQYRYNLVFTAHHKDVARFSILTNLAHAYMKTGQLDEADKVFAQALRQNALAVKSGGVSIQPTTNELKRTLMEYAWVKRKRFDQNASKELMDRANAL